MNFELIASPDWVTALSICNVNLGEGVQQMNIYLKIYLQEDEVTIL